ncbi:fimbria/pilus periplasmic chaperone [Citrobacter amalonaticus]|uniref:Fimbria/pilus periplasmic chaperone n=1 Tax=Citrobacter amalonaticus TaxID=35703 RepID=A0A8I0MQV3_CITAM|nr:fimbria/pilus periplasmic chaperone [Citrobacter amalonaticus]MBE0131284.1 fimbria/pilus periplasmic chaperone [Citrobacter amalonaticus]
MKLLSKKTAWAIFIASAGMAISQPNYASIVMNGTRVIYQGNKNEVTISLTNKNTRPVLIQSWIDTGNENATPEKISVPFVLSPPVNRVDPDKGQTIRISYTGVPALPQDKESVYWLNVLEVPSKDKKQEASQQKLNVVFRTRIKLFYRPGGLEGDSIQAADNLHWRLNGQNATAQNNSKYNVTVFTINFKGSGVSSEAKGAMIAPGESHTFSLKNSGNIDGLSFDTINDYGALINHKAKS